jgi:hypothetical protein
MFSYYFEHLKPHIQEITEEMMGPAWGRGLENKGYIRNFGNNDFESFHLEIN